MWNFLNQSVLELTDPILSSFENHPSTVKVVVLEVVSDLLGLSAKQKQWESECNYRHRQNGRM